MATLVTKSNDELNEYNNVYPYADVEWLRATRFTQ